MSRPGDAGGVLGRGRPAVVTGQQAGLLGGPLFTLGKLLGAVALARVSAALPVFWIECDDADIKEVDEVRLLAADGTLRTLSLGEPDDLRPVFARTLGPGIRGLLDEVEALLGAEPAVAETMADLRHAYVEGRRWHEAFGAYLARLTAGLGVELLDPTSPEAKAAARPLFARVLADPEAVEEALRAGAALVADPQVPHIPGELPLFLLDEEGRRRKLERRAGLPEGRLALKGTATTLGRGELETILEKEPGRFSPGVLLRPLVQDSLLATLAYVAGPAEARYHAQLPPLYELLGVRRPDVVARPRLALLEPRARRALEKLGGARGDAHADPDLLRARAAVARAPVDPVQAADATLGHVRGALGGLRERLLPLDPGGLTRAFAEADTAIAYHLQKLGKRAAAAIERRDSDAQGHARTLAALLRPGGEPQERVLAAAPFLARAGRERLVAAILDAIDPADLGRPLTLDV